MKKYLFFYLLIFILSNSIERINAQNKSSLSTIEVDRLTYQQYLNADWKNLIKTGKEAIKHHIDFYYLKVRLGIAYFHVKKYRKAIPYLQEAYTADPKNTVVASYLYNAYLFSGRTLDAYRLAQYFPFSLRKKISFNQDKFIEQAGIAYKQDIISDYTADMNNGPVEQDVIKNNAYYGFDMLNYYNGGHLFYMNAGIISLELQHYYVEDNIQQSEAVSLTQYQLYFANYSQISEGLNWSFAFNNLFIKNTEEIVQSINPRRSGLITNTYITYDFAGFTALRKDFNAFRMGLTATFGYIDKNWQAMPAFELVYYPLGNANLYFYTSPAYKMEDTDIEDANQQIEEDFIIKSGFGLKLGPLFVDASYTDGNMYHYIENDALVVYNDNEKMSQRYELLLTTYLFKGRMKWYAKAQQYTKTNYYLRNTQQQQINYNNQTITTGILWKF